MKNLSKLFVGIALIFGAMILINSCAMNATIDDVKPVVTDTPPTGYDLLIGSLYGREVVDSAEVSYKISIKPKTCGRYMFSNSSSGSEFDATSKTAFKLFVNTGDDRVQKSLGVVTGTNLLVAFCDSETFDWNKAKTTVIPITGWLLKTGYTQLQNTDGKNVTMACKVDGKVVSVDTATGDLVLIAFDNIDRSLTAADNTDASIPDWVTYTTSMDSGASVYAIVAYWPAADVVAVASLDWSKAIKKSILISANKVDYDKFDKTFINSSNPTKSLEGIRFMLAGADMKQVSPSVLSGVTVKWAFSAYSSSGYPTLTTGNPLGSSIDLSTSSSSDKFLLVALWGRGKNTANLADAVFGYYELTGIKLPAVDVRGPDSTGLSHGQNIALAVGEKLTASVSGSDYSELYYYIGTSEPSSKSTYSGIQNRELNGKLTMEITYTGGTNSLYFWGKGKNGVTYGDFFRLSISQKTVAYPVTSISLSQTSLSMQVGGSPVTLVVTINPNNASNQACNWATSNSAVAIVSATGVVTQVGAGTATITVTAQDQTAGIKTATCSVTVSNTSVSTDKYLYLSTTWAGQQVKITFENGGGTTGTYTVGSDGKIPTVVSGTPKLSLNLFYEGKGLDAAGNSGAYSQCQSSDWNGDSVLFTSYTNGTFTATGRTVTLTRK